MDDFDSLLTAPPARPKRGRPSKEDLAPRAAEAAQSLEMQAEFRKAAAGSQSLQIEQFGYPVTMNFLARLMRQDPMRVNTRLARCPVAQVVGKGKRKVYWFHEAIHFLVTPKMSPEEFARTLNKASLPPEINKAFWDSQRSRVKYKIESQEAWETEDVLGALGDVAMLLTDSLTMVVEELRGRAKLTDEQAEVMTEHLDGLREEIRRKLVELPAQRSTASMFGKPLFGVNDRDGFDPAPPDFEVEDDDDDEGD